MKPEQREQIEAAVKLEVLVHWIGVSALDGGNADLIMWLNAWLGPHWILVPGVVLFPPERGIAIQRKGQYVYKGPLGDIPTSRLGVEHDVARKLWHAAFLEDVMDLAARLNDLVQQYAGVLSPAELQGAVSGFFEDALRGADRRG